jgi:peptidoglycan L-alanyl-D-glutamate endopeptidase CwlK
MKDAVSIARVKLLHPKIRDEVAALISKVEFNNPKFAVRIVQGLRTIDEQNALYAQGRTAPGNIVTNARGGSSLHNYGLAIDFALLYDKDGDGKYETLSWDTGLDYDKDGVKDWQEVVNEFKAGGYEWGGDWKSIKDDPHLQKTFGHGWRFLLTKYQQGDFIPGTKYVNL